MNSVRLLLATLFAFLRPAADGDAANVDGGDDKGVVDDKAGASDAEEQLDLGLDADAGGDKDADAEEPDPKAEAAAAREEAKREREGRERAEREAAELRIRHTPRPQDDELARESARLADPATPELERWQIQSNRTLRQNTNAANMALMQANDVNDRTAYQTLALSNPVAKKYEARVEEELANARKAGMNPSRESILRYKLGEDMLKGNFKKKAAPAAGKTVDRGKLPGARSDVGKSGQSERDKRRARLENLPI